jgi:phosphatidylglycerophosphate synthase
MREILTQTKEQWDGFSPEQKVAAASATALTVARPVLAVSAAARGLDHDRAWTSGDAMQLGAAYLTDLEGNIARAADAETALGGAGDPMADKIASAAPEIVMATRGEESWTNVAIKLARDIGISALRSHVLQKTEGRVSISAGWSGKANTALRQVTNVVTMSPLGEKYPKTRRSLQTLSALATVASGVHTGYKLWQEVKKDQAKTASREAASHEV